MKSLLVSLLALSLSTGLCLAACAGDSKKSVRAAGGEGGQGGDEGGAGLGAGGSAIGMAGAGGEDAGGAGPGAGGMLAGAGAPMGAGGEGGTAAPTFEAVGYRGYMSASISGSSVELVAEFIDEQTTPAEEAAVANLLHYITASAREDSGPDCIPEPTPFEDWLNVPLNVARGDTLTLSADGTELLTAMALATDPIVYIGAADPGALAPDSFGFGSGSLLLGLEPDPVDVPTMQGGFVNTSFAWLSTDNTFPIDFIVVNTPPPGAQLVLRIGNFLCRVPVPENADEGFVFNVPQMVVDTLPVYPQTFQTHVSSIISRNAPVADGWVRLETYNAVQESFANGSIDAP